MYENSLSLVLSSPSDFRLQIFFFSGQQQSAWTCDYFQPLFDGVQVCFKHCVYTGCIDDAALVKPKEPNRS